MIVFQRTTTPRPKSTLIVCPAKEGADSVEFRDASGEPLQIQVVFINGRAEVPNNLGRWMVDRGYATSLILPAQKLINAFRRPTHGTQGNIHR